MISPRFLAVNKRSPERGSVDFPQRTPRENALCPLFSAHLKHSGFIILSGDVARTQANLANDVVPTLNTSKAESIASMEKIKRMIVTYKARIFINHDKKQTDTLKLLPAFYD